VLVYDRAGVLVDRKRWPSALSEVKEGAGDAFCCVSEEPPKSGMAGPPPDCKVLTYGADIDEHFRGLHDEAHRPLLRSQLPPHKYLIVEYYASWCSPCILARRTLDRFMRSVKSGGYVSLVVDFSALLG
jgi:thiol-disulfide isomerase/thioredoxin